MYGIGGMYVAINRWIDIYIPLLLQLSLLLLLWALFWGLLADVVSVLYFSY